MTVRGVALCTGDNQPPQFFSHTPPHNHTWRRSLTLSLHVSRTQPRPGPARALGAEALFHLSTFTPQCPYKTIEQRARCTTHGGTRDVQTNRKYAAAPGHKQKKPSRSASTITKTRATPYRPCRRPPALSSQRRLTRRVGRCGTRWPAPPRAPPPPAGAWAGAAGGSSAAVARSRRPRRRREPWPRLQPMVCGLQPR